MPALRRTLSHPEFTMPAVLVHGNPEIAADSRIDPRGELPMHLADMAVFSVATGLRQGNVKGLE